MNGDEGVGWDRVLLGRGCARPSQSALHTEPRIAKYSQVLDAINSDMGVAINENKEPAQAATTAIAKDVNRILQS